MLRLLPTSFANVLLAEVQLKHLTFPVAHSALVAAGWQASRSSTSLEQPSGQERASL